MADEDRSHILRPGAARRRRAAEGASDGEGPAPATDESDDVTDAGASGPETVADAADGAEVTEDDVEPAADEPADDEPADVEATDDGATDDDEPDDDETADEDTDAVPSDVDEDADEVDGELGDESDDGDLDDGDDTWVAEEDELEPEATNGRRRTGRRADRQAEVAGETEDIPTSGLTAPFRRLYRGQTSFDFVGRRRTWFTISAIIIVAGMFSLGFRGLNLGIDFQGGTQWEVLAPGVSQTEAINAVQAAGLSQPTVEVLGGRTIAVQDDLNNLSPVAQAKVTNEVSQALAKLAHTNLDGVSVDHVGPTWGSQVTDRALLALGVFFVVVGIYISFRFEPKMALAAFIAMIHDLLVTIGIYSLAGFQVTPDTVIAVLTILGYSLYDTVVVFDRVRDNTRGPAMASGRMTYSEMVNLSMNQTLARSVNTSLVAILPVLSVLVVGAYILGATTLQNYGLALTVGLISGAYSSIFIASPVLAIMKEREPHYVAIRHRVESRRDRYGVLTPAAAAAMAGGLTTGPTRPGGGSPRPAKGAKNRPASPPAPGSTVPPPPTGDGASPDAHVGEVAEVVVAAAATEAVVARAASPARRPPAKRRNRGKGGKRRR